MSELDRFLAFIDFIENSDDDFFIKYKEKALNSKELVGLYYNITGIKND